MLLVRLIKLYQNSPLSSHSYCKFEPSCSNYAIEAINEYGSLKGSFLAIKRILRCNPFNKKSGYDPVPKRSDTMKKLKMFLLPIIAMILFSGCSVFKVDNMEDIDIITTSYPLEYILNTLYGKHANISSIYPDATDTYTYKLNDKALENYSKKDLFVYVSYGRDKDIAVNLLNRNKELLIIDGSLGMKPDYIDELWLNPSNLLMVAQNVKNGLTEYINNNYLIKDVEKNFETLKLDLSMLDAEIKLTAENARYKTILSSTKSLNYLKKYGFNVISLDDDNPAVEKTLQEVKTMISNNTIKYIYSLENTDTNEIVKELINEGQITEIKLKRLDSINDNERHNHETTYFTLMNNNIDQLKKETYK